MTAPAVALEPAGAWKPSVTIRYSRAGRPRNAAIRPPVLRPFHAIHRRGGIGRERQPLASCRPNCTARAGTAGRVTAFTEPTQPTAELRAPAKFAFVGAFNAALLFRYPPRRRDRTRSRRPAPGERHGRSRRSDDGGRRNGHGPGCRPDLGFRNRRPGRERLRALRSQRRRLARNRALIGLVRVAGGNRRASVRPLSSR